MAEPAGSEIRPASLAGEAAARAFFEQQFATTNPAVETLFVAHLDDAAACIHLSTHAGDAEGAELPLRLILADALAHRSSGIVLAHNHPSGDATPSASDRQATRRLAMVSEAIDLTLVDHLVFGAGDCVSFRRMGLL